VGDDTDGRAARSVFRDGDAGYLDLLLRVGFDGVVFANVETLLVDGDTTSARTSGPTRSG